MLPDGGIEEAYLTVMDAVEEIGDTQGDKRRIGEYVSLRVNSEMLEKRLEDSEDVPPHETFFFEKDLNYLSVRHSGEINSCEGNVFDEKFPREVSPECGYTLVFRKPLNKEAYKTIVKGSNDYSFRKDFAEDALVFCENPPRVKRNLIKAGGGEGHFHPLMEDNEVVDVQDICLQNRVPNCPLYENLEEELSSWFPNFLQGNDVELYSVDHRKLVDFLLAEISQEFDEDTKEELEEKVELLLSSSSTLFRKLEEKPLESMFGRESSGSENYFM